VAPFYDWHTQQAVYRVWRYHGAAGNLPAGLSQVGPDLPSFWVYVDPRGQAGYPPNADGMESTMGNDVDGDGLMDLMQAHVWQDTDTGALFLDWTYWHNHGGGFDAPIPSGESAFYHPHQARAFDYDGDGRGEVLLWRHDGEGAGGRILRRSDTGGTF